MRQEDTKICYINPAKYVGSYQSNLSHHHRLYKGRSNLSDGLSQICQKDLKWNDNSITFHKSITLVYSTKSLKKTVKVSYCIECTVCVWYMKKW